MNRLSELAVLSVVMAATSVVISIYGIAPYNTYFAWIGIGFSAIAIFAVVSRIRLSRA